VPAWRQDVIAARFGMDLIYKLSGRPTTTAMPPSFSRGPIEFAGSLGRTPETHCRALRIRQETLWRALGSAPACDLLWHHQSSTNCAFKFVISSPAVDASPLALVRNGWRESAPSCLKSSFGCKMARARRSEINSEMYSLSPPSTYVSHRGSMKICSESESWRASKIIGAFASGGWCGNRGLYSTRQNSIAIRAKASV